MSNKTRVLHVRVVGFSAPERQMLNSIFLLSVAPARQIGYKLWNPEAGVAPDMYLLDGDSDSAVASWQATFSSTSDRTLVVGSKNIDLGVAVAARPLGLKVVGAMDRLAIAIQSSAIGSVSKESALHDVSGPRAGTLPTGGITSNDMSVPAPPKPDLGMPRSSTGTTVQQPALSSGMNGPAPFSATAAGATLAGAAAAATLSSTTAASTMTRAAGAAPGALAAAAADAGPMTAAAPAATVLPQVVLQPNGAADEKPVTDKTVDRILTDKLGDRSLGERTLGERTLDKPALPPTSGATPLSPTALAAAVAPSNGRANLRVVPTPPLSASLPASARIPDAPMTATVPVLKQDNPKADAPKPDAPALATAAAAVPSATVSPAALTPPAPAPAPVPAAPVGHGAQLARHEEHNFRVLAVDDSPLMRTFLQNKLQPYGIQPEFASSGEEALFKISKNHFDMIFLDVMLPGMDGYDVCKMIKKNKDNSLMKVVMLTSKDKTFDKIRGTMAGCDGYLTKPVDEMKLRAIIERHTVTKK
ncbi:MAG TPA: response regulator [Steroidobacteraceae bacterium]|nr:response regulator [Steroidobacteraceae bacterium]